MQFFHQHITKLWTFHDQEALNFQLVSVLSVPDGILKIQFFRQLRALLPIVR